MAVLLFHIYEAAKSPDLALVDADHSVEGLTKHMRRKPANIPISRVESALYFCNLLDEEGRFWHPQDKTFKEFMAELESSWWHAYQFDSFNNILKVKQSLYGKGRSSSK